MRPFDSRPWRTWSSDGSLSSILTHREVLHEQPRTFVPLAGQIFSTAVSRSEGFPRRLRPGPGTIPNAHPTPDPGPKSRIPGVMVSSARLNAFPRATVRGCVFPVILSKLGARLSFLATARMVLATSFPRSLIRQMVKRRSSLCSPARGGTGVRKRFQPIVRKRSKNRSVLPERLGALPFAIERITLFHDTELQKPGTPALPRARRCTVRPPGAPRKSVRHTGAPECVHEPGRHGPSGFPVAQAQREVCRVLGGDHQRQLEGDLPVQGRPCRRCRLPGLPLGKQCPC